MWGRVRFCVCGRLGVCDFFVQLHGLGLFSLAGGAVWRLGLVLPLCLYVARLITALPALGTVYRVHGSSLDTVRGDVAPPPFPL